SIGPRLPRLTLAAVPLLNSPTRWNFRRWRRPACKLGNADRTSEPLQARRQRSFLPRAGSSKAERASEPPSRSLTRHIRALCWPPAKPHAFAKPPRLGNAACPYPAFTAPGFILRRGVSTEAVARPIQRQPVAHEPIDKINTVDRAGSDGATVWVEQGKAGRSPTHRCPTDECARRGFRACRRQ